MRSMVDGPSQVRTTPAPSREIAGRIRGATLLVLPLPLQGRGTMRSMVEGVLLSAAEEPLHRPSAGPPPPEIRGRNQNFRLIPTLTVRPTL
jgi:hypothetical protein